MNERIYEKQGDTLLKPKEEIIRCKDCKHVDLKDFIHGTCKYRTGELTPTSYCERGEKKWTGQPEE